MTQPWTYEDTVNLKVIRKGPDAYLIVENDGSRQHIKLTQELITKLADRLDEVAR